MRTIYAHLHIPKCGGSTVVDLLSRNFPGAKLANTNGILNDYQYDAAQVAKIIDHFPDLKCLTGHKLSLQLPFDREDLEIHAFSFVRDPVERFVSHYFFHRNHTTLVPEAKTMDLDRYVDWALAHGNQKSYINGQTRFLGGGNLELIKSAAKEKRLYLFPLSRLQESFATLGHLFPNDFSDVSVSGRKNVSKKDQTIPDDLRDRVLPYVSDDLELLALAERTPLVVKADVASGARQRKRSLATRSVKELGRVMVRCGNYLSSVG